MSLNSRLKEAQAAVQEIAHLIQINAKDLADSEKVMAARKVGKKRAPRGSVQLHKQLHADQRARTLKQAALQAALARLEEEVEATGSNATGLSSPLTSCSSMEDSEPLPGVGDPRCKSPTPAPSTRGSPGPPSKSAFDGFSARGSPDAPTETAITAASEGRCSDEKADTAAASAGLPQNLEPSPTPAAAKGPEVAMADGTQASFPAAAAGMGVEVLQSAVLKSSELEGGSAAAGLEQSILLEEMPAVIKPQETAALGAAFTNGFAAQLSDVDVTGDDAGLFKMDIEEKWDGPLEPAEGASGAAPIPHVAAVAGPNEKAIKKPGKRKQANEGAEEGPGEDGDILDEKDLLEAEENGRKAITAYVEKGEEIDPSIRRLARLHQSFLPESATTSREVALHILSTTWDGFACLYHHVSDKDFKARNKKPPVQGFWLLGVTGEVRKKNDKRPPSHGHLRCGCSTEAALSYFLWWKTWTLRGPDGTVEPMSAIQFNPRARNLVMQKLEQLTGVTIDNSYPQGGFSYSSLEHQRDLLRVQLKHVLEGLKKANLGLGPEAYTAEDAQIFREATQGTAAVRGVKE